MSKFLIPVSLSIFFLIFLFTKYTFSEDNHQDLHVFWGEDFTHEVGLGDDVVLDMRVENTGDLLISDVTILFDYEGSYLLKRSSDCNLGNEGAFYPAIHPGEVLGCKLILNPVGTPSGLTKLRKSLIFNGKHVETLFVTIFPDIEISLSYEDGELNFYSSHPDLRFLIKQEFLFQEKSVCKRYLFFGLKTEICPII